MASRIRASSAGLLIARQPAVTDVALTMLTCGAAAAMPNCLAERNCSSIPSVPASMRHSASTPAISAYGLSYSCQVRTSKFAEPDLLQRALAFERRRDEHRIARLGQQHAGGALADPPADAGEIFQRRTATHEDGVHLVLGHQSLRLAQAAFAFGVGDRYGSRRHRLQRHDRGWQGAGCLVRPGHAGTQQWQRRRAQYRAFQEATPIRTDDVIADHGRFPGLESLHSGTDAHGHVLPRPSLVVIPAFAGMTGRGNGGSELAGSRS
ncbi:hypothetical protein RLIN73S_06210 [Rhodanobacter lindaniclasticus]